MVPLKAAANTPQQVLGEDDIDGIFSNLVGHVSVCVYGAQSEPEQDELLPVHDALVERLLSRQKEATVVKGIADVIRESVCVMRGDKFFVLAQLKVCLFSWLRYRSYSSIRAFARTTRGLLKHS